VNACDASAVLQAMDEFLAGPGPALHKAIVDRDKSVHTPSPELIAPHKHQARCHARSDGYHAGAPKKIAHGAYAKPTLAGLSAHRPTRKVQGKPSVSLTPHKRTPCPATHPGVNPGANVWFL